MFDLHGRLISNPEHWDQLQQKYLHFSDEELERLGKTSDGFVKQEEYMAGDFDKWNKPAGRKEGDIYLAINRYTTILTMRKDKQTVIC